MKIEVYSDQQYTVIKIAGVEYRAAWLNEKVAIQRTAELAQLLLDHTGETVSVTEVSGG